MLPSFHLSSFGGVIVGRDVQEVDGKREEVVANEKERETGERQQKEEAEWVENVTLPGGRPLVSLWGRTQEGKGVSKTQTCC